MEPEAPRPEHLWLQRLVGEWTYTTEMTPGPDQPPHTSTGRETVRSLGQLWTLGEWTNDAADDCVSQSVMTLGYDPAKKCFVGTFISSMMSHLWPYTGSLDAAGRVLTLDSEGPSFAGDGTLAHYQDVIEFLSDDHRTLTARVQGPDGQWTPFMTSHYRRVNTTGG
jgi:hypothetical protein